MDDERYEIIKAGAPNAPPEQALYRIQQTYPDGSGGRLNIDWEGLLQLHELIHSSAEGSGYPAVSSTRVTSIARIRRSCRRRTRCADW